jgi:hypothetical protein
MIELLYNPRVYFRSGIKFYWQCSSFRSCTIIQDYPKLAGVLDVETSVLSAFQGHNESDLSPFYISQIGVNGVEILSLYTV